ncbi:MAG: hypothetical protein QOG34_2014 [Frankiaceae bacterium]|jgi:uncharacterized protein (TIGR03083 family)|nr:hypothetical protein [Frankiaceae bacterium]
MSNDPWPVIHAERQALADDLAGLTDEQWKTPSLCGGWTVLDVVGHMVATARMTPPRFFGRFLGSGFNFDKMTAKDVAAETSGGPAATLAAFRDTMSRTTSPPGPIDAMLGEVLIHPDDIRRPLGIAHDYPSDAVVRVLDFFKKSNLIIGAKKRIDGLELKATDANWTHGAGPRVNGPAHSLLMAMTGRKEALSDLSGDGVETLRSR